MKKTSNILLLIGGVLILLGLIFSSFNITNIYKPFLKRGSGNYKAMSLELDNIDKINLKAFDDKIDIYEYDGNKIKIHYYKANHEEFKKEIIEETQTINLTKKWDGKLVFFDMNFQTPPTIKIEVPKGKLIKYDIKTSNAKMNIENINMQNSTFKTSNAKIHTNNIQTRNTINFKSSNGKIELNNVRARSIKTETSNGNITAKNTYSKNIDLITNNNSIILDKVTSNNLFVKTSNNKIETNKVKAKNINLKTSNGRITGNIIGNFKHFDKYIKTSNSDIEINGNEFGNKIIQEEGKTNKLNIKTSNGRIKLNIK